MNTDDLLAAFASDVMYLKKCIRTKPGRRDSRCLSQNWCNNSIEAKYATVLRKLSTL
jgi:hypothetical protein